MAIAYFNFASPALYALHQDLTEAVDDGRDFRIEVGQTINVDTGVGRNWIKWKLGEGMWSPPFYEDVDPYRDR